MIKISTSLGLPTKLPVSTTVISVKNSNEYSTSKQAAPSLMQKNKQIIPLQHIVQKPRVYHTQIVNII